MKKIFVFTFLLLCLKLNGQNTKGISVANQEKHKEQGKTYAIICGISNYRFIQKLNYATADALMFSQMLQSEAGGNVPAQNIRLLIDNEVTAPNIIVKSLGWLAALKPKKGDKIYLYFSGHGDAISQDESFLLMSDADPAGDKNNYAVSGALQLFNLKNRIRNFTSQDIEVILIIDACRTNELPGGQEGLNNTTESMIEKKAGELLFLSASANEYSYEDKQWGNGHGAFTWYLVNGMQGAADEDGDKKITVDELQTYVIRNVKKDTRKLGKVQTPFYCCNSFNTEVISYATIPVNSNSNTTLATDDFHNIALSNKSKSTDVISTEDSVFEKLFVQMQQALNDKRFIAPDAANADSIYNLIANSTASKDFKDKARFELASAFIDEAQEAVNFVFGAAGKNWSGRNYYHTHSAMLAKAIELLKNDFQDYIKELEPRLLYLEANTINDYQSMRYSDNGKTITTFVYAEDGKEIKYDELKDSIISKLQKSISLGYNKANVYCSISIVYLKCQMFDSAMVYGAKSITLANNWFNPYCIVARAYAEMDSVDKVDSIISIALNSVRPDAEMYGQIAEIYNDIPSRGIHAEDRVRRYSSMSLMSDSLNYTAINSLLNLIESDCDSLAYWNKKLWLYVYSSTNNCMSCYLKNHEFNKLKKTAEYFLQRDSTNFRHYSYLFTAEYFLGEGPNEKCFLVNKALKEQNSLSHFYEDLGNNFKKMKKYDLAELYFIKAWKNDSLNDYLNYELGIFYQNNLKDNVSAAVYYQKLMNSKSRELHSNAVLFFLEDYLKNSNSDSLNVYLDKIERGIITWPQENYLVAKCYAAMNNKSNSIKHLKNAIYYDNNYKWMARIDNNFISIKTDSEFIKLISMDSTIDYPVYCNKMGEEFYHLKQYVCAIPYYIKSAQLLSDPEEKKWAIYQAACCYSLLNQKENAIINLETALENKFDDYNHIMEDSDLDNIRNTPAFKKLLKKYFPDQYKEK
ncbi:MAG: caspase family protein [Bacteroidia bacterium]